MEIHNIAQTAIVVGSALVFGLLVDRFLVRILIKKAEQEQWKVLYAAFRSLRGMIVIWILLPSIYSVLDNFPLTTRGELIAGKALAILTIITIIIFASRLAIGLLRPSIFSGSTEGETGARTILVNLSRVVIATLGIFGILRVLGVAITPVLTALGVGGLAVALAMQDTLTNLFAGIYIISSKQMEVGHVVKLSSGEEGKINDITWRTTTLRTSAGNLIVIPNSKFAQASLTNYSLPSDSSTLIISFVVTSGSDPEKVEKTTFETARAILATKDEWKEAAADVHLVEQNDAGVRYNISIKPVAHSDHGLIRHLIMKKLLQTFPSAGIQLAFRTIV